MAATGKRIMNLQISLALLNRVEGAVVVEPDKYDREPFSDPSVDLLPRLSEESRRDMTSSIRLATFAENMGMLNVLRWKPRKVRTMLFCGNNCRGKGADRDGFARRATLLLRALNRPCRRPYTPSWGRWRCSKAARLLSGQCERGYYLI